MKIASPPTLVIAFTLTTIVGGAAYAQYVSSIPPEPLYPYAQPQYVQPAPQGYPYVRSVPPQAAPPPRVSKTDPALIEELRKIRHKKKKESVEVEKKESKTDDKTIKVGKKEIKIDKKIVVREKPVVRKHYRVIDDPTIVVQREIDESQLRPAPPRAEQPSSGRVIHAEAEVTILGPDRMSIRLYRKPDGRDANAKALPKKTKASKTVAKDEPQT